MSPLGFGVMSCLLGQLMILPVQAARKTFAIVPVLSNEVVAKDQGLLPEALKLELADKHKVHLADEQALTDYFTQESQGDASVSEGDQHYIEAKQSYLQFNNKAAEKSLQQALTKYAVDPGTQGGFYQAFLLQALMEDEKAQSSKAKKSMENAIAHNVSQTELNDTFFSPRFRQMYKIVRDEYLKKNPATTVSVQVVGTNSTSPIYANGVDVGHGPTAQIQVVPEQILFLQAGDQGKLYQTKPRKEQDNHIKIRSQLGKGKNASGMSYGFAAQTPNLVKEAQWLGRTAKASHIVLLSSQKIKAGYDVGLSVVDSQSGKITETKHFELANFKKDAAQASSVMAQYIVDLEKKDYVDEPEDSLPIVIAQKKSSALLLSVLGGVLVAGVTGAVLLAESSISPNSGVEIDLPPDAVDDPNDPND